MRITKEPNTKHKKTNTNNGITLIALIITIIVMLILVSVTISMAIKGGLFEKAGKATGDTKNAINAEQKLANGAIQIDGVWYDSIDDYLNGKPSQGQTKTIKISYDYDKTEGIENTTVNLQFEIGGVLTFEEFTEEYLNNKSPEDLEAEFVKAISYPGSFEEFIAENYESKEQFVEEVKNRTGLEYEEGLKSVIVEGDWIGIEYKVALCGGLDKDATGLEELFVKVVNYPGNFDSFLAEEKMTREQLEQMAQGEGLTYEAFLKIIIARNCNLRVTISNGKTLTVEYFILTTSFTINRNGTYTVTAVGANGEKGETTIVITNLYEEKFSEIYKENTPITQGSYTAVIPKGFAVGISEGINKIETGLVITDAVDNEGYSIGNEFVWIPVTEDLGSSYSSGTNYSEPTELTSNFSSSGAAFDSQATLDYLYGANYYNYAEDFKYADEYAEMVRCVNANDGFYIGRYETTIDDDRNIGSKYNTRVLTAGTTYTNNSTTYYYRWYGLYYAQKNANVTGNGSIVQTAMIYGVLYDKAMDFIRTQKTAGKTTYDVDTATSSWHTRSWVVNSGKANPGATGDVALNIWDLEGNAKEWTQEARSPEYRVYRGGSYASYRLGLGPKYAEDDTAPSSRLALYIK